MEVVAGLLLIAFFLCGLINSLFFPHHKFFPWIRSLILSTSKPQKNEIKEKKEDFDLEILFSTFDADGDGFISKGELAESLRRLGLTASGGEMSSMMERVDANDDGLIDLDEFRELCFSLGIASSGGAVEREEEEEKEGELQRAFGVFDRNGDGLITMEELGMVLSSLGLKQGGRAEACREMIKKVDLDGDGMVNFEEFKTMMVTKEGNVF